MIQQKNKCIFPDRDGLLNLDRSSYTFQIEDFKNISGVPEALVRLKNGINSHNLYDAAQKILKESSDN